MGIVTVAWFSTHSFSTVCAENIAYQKTCMITWPSLDLDGYSENIISAISTPVFTALEAGRRIKTQLTVPQTTCPCVK